MILPNIVSFVGQLDNHAPYLTVKETFEFAHNCRTGRKSSDDANADSSGSADFTENLTIEGLDLAHVADTFVGNDVRGVSGGQRRRGQCLVLLLLLPCSYYETSSLLASRFPH